MAWWAGRSLCSFCGGSVEPYGPRQDGRRRRPGPLRLPRRRQRVERRRRRAALLALGLTLAVSTFIFTSVPAQAQTACAPFETTTTTPTGTSTSSSTVPYCVALMAHDSETGRGEMLLAYSLMLFVLGALLALKLWP